MQHPPARLEIAVVSPIYDDWEAARRLIADLRQLEETWDARLSVFLIDDGSPSAPPQADFAGGSDGLEVTLVRLARNCGHQQAIALGLCRALSTCAAEIFVVMDGDGEDRPADLPRLVQPLIEDPSLACVLAKRGRRNENLLFRLGHAVYMGLATLLTSERIDFGNFFT